MIEFDGVRNLPNYPWCLSQVEPEWRDQIQLLVDDLNQLVPGAWTIAQIKEKFGGLRFYIDLDYDKVDGDLDTLVYTRISMTEKECDFNA